METLDFNCLTETQTRKLNDIANENRSKYMEFIEKISVGQKEEWWLTKTASRNSTFVYTALYQILLAIYYIKKDLQLKKIVVYEKEVGQILEAYICQTSKTILVQYRGNSMKKSYIFSYFGFICVWLKKLYEFLVVKLKWKKQKLPKQPILLIDTYIMNTCMKENGYADRYFNYILKYVKREYTYFSTILLNNKKEPLWIFLNKLKVEEQYQFLPKEYFLSLRDYISFLKWPLLNRRFANKRYIYEGIDISPLVKKDLYNGMWYVNSFDGWIARQFVKQLKRKHVKLEKAILWYEGQPSSIGLIQGIRKWYPNTPVMGYNGLPFLENDLGGYPIKIQYEDNSAPDVIGVIGKRYAKIPKRYWKDLSVCLCPAFRYPNIYKMIAKTRLRRGEKKRLLILLSYFIETSKELLQSCLNMDQDYEIYIKNHPMNEEYNLKDYGISGIITATFIKGDLIQALRDKDIVVTAETTSGMEIISQGVGLIMYVPSGNLINCGLPEELEGRYYKMVFGSEELKKVMKKIVKEEHNFEKEDIREEYFEPVNTKSVERMLKFKNYV